MPVCPVQLSDTMMKVLQVTQQSKQNRNTIEEGGGAGVRGCEEADYLCEASACNEQKLGGAKALLAP